MRLIDADALKEMFCVRTKDAITEEWVKLVIDDAPTIEARGDLISRADAIDAIFKVGHEHVEENLIRIGLVTDYSDAIRSLPSIEAISFDFSKLSSGQLYDIRRHKATASTDAVSREAHYDAVANRITDMEERGFVSVVRCKDCRFAEKGTALSVEETDEGTPRNYIDWFKCHNYKGSIRYVGYDDYCSWGERKGGDDE